MAREAKQAARSGIRWRLWLGVALAGVLCAATGMAALKVHEYAMSAPEFTLARYEKDALAISGVKYASRSKVQHVFAQDFGRSIFAIPVAERRRHLMAIDWVEDASISRIWPDRMVVRIRERQPVAFVYFKVGVLLIDAHGVLLELPGGQTGTDAFSYPVLSGVREEESETDREERVHALLRVQEDFGYQAKDISEVNAADLENIRVIAKLENRAVELILGDSNFGRRYQNFVNHFAEISRQSPEGKTFDLRLDDRITAKE